MQNRLQPSQQDILLFKTITEADEATSTAYLRANNNITEALNAFFNNRVAQVQIARSQTMPTTSIRVSQSAISTSNRVSLPQTQATTTVVRTQSTAPTQVIRNPQVVQSSASTSRHRSRSRKSKKDRRKSAAPATGLVEVNSDEKKKKTVVPKKKERSPGPKRTFSEMISQCMQESLSEEAKKKKWPKYLGSLKVECELELHMVNTEAGQIDVGDAVTFNIPDIEFRMSNFRKAVPTYTLRGASLLVEVHNKRKRIGYIRCAYEEIFYFLLHMKYIKMEGTVLTKPALPGNGQKKVNRFDTRLDIFLTEWVISNPLNIMVTQPGRKAEASKIEPEKSKEPESQINAIFGDIIKKKKKNTKKEDDLSEEEQKTQQISRMAKESFIKLFEYLQIKINIPTVVQLKKRADPFNPVRRDKYGGYRITFHDTHIYCYDKAPELITADYPTYYEKKDKPNVVQQQLQQAIPEEADSSMEIINMGSAKKEENPEETKARIEEDLNELEKKLLKKMTAEDNAMFSQKPKKINRRRTHAFGTYAFSDESSEDFDEYNSDDSQDDNPRQLFKSKSEVKDRNRLSSPPKNQEGMMPIDNPIPAAASNNNDFYNPFQAFQQQQQNRESNHDASSSEDQGGEAKDGIKSHLNDLFNLQNQNSNCFSLSEPPKTFKSTLHMYQKQALTWMKYREGCLENQRLYDKLNEEIRLLNDLFEEIVLIDGSKIYFNPFNGEITLDFPLSKPTKGGILADEMGLGKTVMTIALIHAHCREAKKKEKEEKKKETSQKKKGRRRASDSDDEEDEEEQQEPEPDDDHHGSEYDENDIDNIASKRGPKKNKKVKKSFGSLQPAVSSGKAGTLIVVPVTVLTQWEDEIYTHSHEGTMKVLQYYGGARAFKKNKIEDFDVVLTTYGVLSADFTKKEKDSKNTSKTLFDYEWFRVILDEAHNVKEKSTRAAKAACGLNTSYRWCLSGTPIQNKIDDIFSIIKFLRVDTWGEYFLWNTYINKHVSNDESFELLRNILRPILLRRTKKSTYSDGTCILALPPKEIKTHTISLTNEEKQIYDYLFYRGKNQFDQIVNGGTLQYEYAHIFELLMRLRQVCNHPGLVFSSADLRNSDNLENAILKFLDKRATSSTLANKKNFVAPLPSSSAAANRGPQNNNNNAQSSSNGISSGFVQETINNLKNKRLEPCTVCLDDIVDPVVTNCCHVFCKGCIAHVIEKLKSCPICRKNLTMTDVISVVVEDREDYAEILDIRAENFKKSSKLIALFEHIHDIRKKKEKCVVFSQFIGMLNLIQKCLEEEKIPFRRIDGSCTQKQRADYIEQFNEDEDICVFMISLKAGAVGLNLTVANHVILVDPWWNPAIEDQAIERVHRIGQKKQVYVTRLISDKTIEARILELHSVKKGLVNMTLQFNPEQQKKQNMENMIHLMKRFDDQ